MFKFSLFKKKSKEEGRRRNEAERLLKQAQLEESQKRQELLQSSFNFQHVKLLNERYTRENPTQKTTTAKDAKQDRNFRASSVPVCYQQQRFSHSSLDVSTQELNSLQLSFDGPGGFFTKPSFSGPYASHSGLNGPSASQHFAQQPTYQVDVYHTICNLFWKPSLSFHPYQFGQSLVGFGSLWPDQKDLEELFTELCQNTLRRSVLDLSRLVVYCGPLRALKALLDSNIIGVNQMFENGNTILHAACLSQNFDAALYLCTCGADTKLRNKNGHTADQLCFCPRIKKLLPHKYHGSGEAEALLEPVKKAPTLLEKQLIFESVDNVKEFDDLLMKLQITVLQKICSADIDLSNSQGMTPLMVAARLGHSVLIDAMVCVLGADPNARNEVRGGWTGLHYACRYNQLDVVSILVKRGADFNLECHHGARPDDLAECHSHQDCMEAISVARRRRVDALKRQIVQEELKASSIRRTDLWVTDDKGNTLLMTAAEHGVYSALDTLLKMAGAPIDAQHEKTLMTALAMAAQLGNAEVVQLLLKSGANPTIHDIQDLLPLHHAVVHQHTVTMEIILQWPEALTGLQKALKLSGTVNIKQILSRAKHRRQQETVTPVLFECAMTGDAQKLYCVLEDGDNVNPTGGMGTWPIYLAVENGHEEIVHMLYERGADITRRHPTTGNTVLHMACARGHLKIARYLLGRYQREPLDIGCPTLDVAVNMYNKQGKTPLILASEKGYSCIVKLLLDHGASTAVVDSSGELYSCEEYQGVQALLENYRKRHLNSIVDAIRDKRGMKRLEEVFRPKFDHHLRDSTGDTPLMVACHQARVEAVKFLLKSAVYTLDHCCSTQRYRRRSTISNADSGAVVDPNSTFDPDQSHDPILTSSPILNSRLQDTNKELTVMNQSQPVLQTSRPTRTNGPKIQTNASLQKINECTALPTNTEQSCLDGEAVHEEVQEKSPNTAAHGESASPPSKTSRPRTKRSKVSEPQLPVTEEEDEDGPYQVPETISSLLESISSVSKGSLLISCNRLSHLAAVNPRDGATVYHRLVESGDNLTLFNLLLDSDESAVNIQDSAGLSPLHLACKLGRKKIVDKMTSLRHVDINCRTLDGKLPEEMATNKNIIKMVQNARAQNPPRSYSPLLSLTNSFFGAPIVSVTGSSVDFEQLNTRFTLMKHQLDLDVS